MSTPEMPARGVQPAPAPSQPSQQHVNAVASQLNKTANALQTQQERNDTETANVNALRGVRSQLAQKEKERGIAAAAQAQRTLNKARQQQLQVGDHVVVDLEKLTPEQQTHGLMQQTRFLHQANAHLASGRINNIETKPTGRVLIVDTPHATLQVPEQLATRADLFDND